MSGVPAWLTRWLPRLERPFRALLWVALCLWLGWLLATWTWWLVAGPTAPVQAQLFETGPSAGAERVSVVMPAAWRIFGQVDATSPVVSEDEPAPDTRLRLELVGLFFHQDTRQGSAIIAAEGRSAELYRVGESIEGSNATVHEVHADRVILLRAGQRETLRLQELRTPAGLTSNDQPAVVRAASARQTRSGVASRAVPAPPPEEGQDTLDNLLQGNMEQVEAARLRQQAISQLGLNSLGSGQGYRIGASGTQPLLQSVGLRAGDVVKSVNGHLLGDEASDIVALEEFRSTGTATIVVQRGAQEITVSFPP